jgi:hypothetical protein
MMQVRVYVGLLVVAIASLWAAASSLEIASQQPRDPYGVDLALQRFAAASTPLPPRGEVGYISDLPLSDNAGTAAFLAAQYALAPRVLVPQVDRKTPAHAIGNFTRPRDYAAAGGKAGYKVQADLGSGVVLFNK